MINASMGELLLILVVALVVFKPEDLARICAMLGSNVGKIRNLLDSLHNTITVIKNKHD